MMKCEICNNESELAFYNDELICADCAKDEMWKDGSIQREIEHHG